jgi:uncharacterized membrane protein YphA (DoxX/SURF4 family)
MTRLVRAWRWWVALCDRREPATAQALVRITVATVLLVDLLMVWRLDLVRVLWTPPPVGFAFPYDGWSRIFGDDQAVVLFGLCVGGLVTLLLGAATRLACVVVVVAGAQLGHLAPDGERGIDTLLRIVVAILAFSHGHAKWSVDAWVRRRLGRPFPREVPAWPRYLLLLQLLWVYSSGGQNKAGAEWGPMGNFAALGNALTDPHFARFAPGWVGAIDPLPRIATAVTMAFEFTAPIYLVLMYFAATRERPGRLRRICNRLHLRWLWIATGLAFQLGIAIGLDLGIFPWGMLALYPVLLLPEELERR